MRTAHGKNRLTNNNKKATPEGNEEPKKIPIKRNEEEFR